MITDYTDPIVTLNQVYSGSSAGSTPVLGACIIGPNYIVRDYEDLGDALKLNSDENYPTTESDSGSNVYSLQTGLTARNLPAQDYYDGKVDTNSVEVFVKDAELVYQTFSDSDTITVDPESDDTISVTSSGSSYVFGSSDGTTPAVAIGDIAYITFTENSSSQVLEASVIGFMKEETKGEFTKCVFDKNIPGSAVTKVVFCKTIDAYVDRGSVSVTTTGEVVKVAVKAGATVTTTLDGVSGSYVILDGNFYVEYRCLSQKFSSVYGMLSDKRDVKGTLGKPCVKNPLGLAVKAALTESNNNFVYFIALPEDPTDVVDKVKLYTAATDLVADKDGIYNIVPCTDQAEVARELLGYVKSQSSEQVPYPKYLMASANLPEKAALGADLTLKVASATLDAAGDTTLVKLQGSPLLTAGKLVKGDVIVSAAGNQYTIEGSNHKDTVHVTGVQTANFVVGSVVKLYHVFQNNDEIISYLVNWKPFADKRASFVFADGPVLDGQEVPLYVVAAALAGLRSAVRPHAPLSNYELKEITTTDARGFTTSQLRTLGAHGFWRVGQNLQGITISRRQLTSAAADDVNLDEQSIICNIDSICFDLKTTGRDIVGKSNISPMLLLILKDTLAAKLLRYQEYTDDLIGPQLLSSTLIDIHQDSVHKDRIYASISGEPPKPFNEFHMTFYIV